MTVLANEQVIDGKGWRSGAAVERRKLSQWFLKITDFADDLLEGLESLDQWPDKVRLMQENWIGKSHGLDFRFRLAEPVERRSIRSRCSPRGPTPSSARASSPSRPTIRSPRPSRRGIRRPPSSSRNAGAAAPASRKSRPQEKKGYRTCVEVVHPLDPEWRLPVYIANFVLTDYGTGALFGVPGP